MQANCVLKRGLGGGRENSCRFVNDASVLGSGCEITLIFEEVMGGRQTSVSQSCKRTSSHSTSIQETIVH